MADSTLDITGEEQPNVTRGHGTEALGPSDSSDTGSDVVGGPGLRDDVGLGLDRGTTEDPGAAGTITAGPDIGDGNLDSDSDSSGTGERADAGRDSARSAQDISPDRIVPSTDEPGAPAAGVDPATEADYTPESASEREGANIQREFDEQFEPGAHKKAR